MSATTITLESEAKVAPLSDDRWPEADLEHLGKCPCCGSEGRELLLEGLRDFAFRAAPGEWSMWRCEACRCGYLDPRPTLASIGRAYENYYTHAASADPAPARTSLKSRLKAKALVAAGQVVSPALAETVLGGKPDRLDRWRRFGQKIRHMPPPSAPGARLLDVGCGDGAFLEVASSLGFAAVGMDLDEAAVNVAAGRGFEVRSCSLPGSGFPEAGFEHVTMNNVLEHLHDPVGALEEVRRLLKPGGRIWLTQPNLGALGLAEFGIHWRGLEPPRHLTLWDTAALKALLERCGFERVSSLPTNPDAADFYFRQSQAQRLGLDPYGATPDLDPETVRKMQEARDRSRREAAAGESLVMVGFRPR